MTSDRYFIIYGYDDNWDMGGSHLNPELCTVKARDRAQAEEYAMTLKGFYDSWHGRGYIEEVKIVDLTEDSNDHTETLNNAIDATFRGAVLRFAEKLKEKAFQGYQVGMYIVDTKTIDELAKEFLKYDK